MSYTLYLGEGQQLKSDKLGACWRSLKVEVLKRGDLNPHFIQLLIFIEKFSPLPGFEPGISSVPS